MLKKLPTILAGLAVLLLCGAALIYGIHLSRTGELGDLLSKPERLLYPYELDTRPAPAAGSAAADPTALLPEAIDAFYRTEQGAPGPFVTDLGLADGLSGDAVEALYDSDDDAAHVVVMRCESPADTKERLALMRDQLASVEGVRTYRAELYGEHPYVKYRYGGWEAGPHGLAWGNGEWLFFVYSETADALDAVVGNFPY